MDGSRFDDLTRALGATRSRRSLLDALAGAALASLGAGSASANGAHSCRSVDNSCNGNGNCCSHNCVKESRTRRICHCSSADDCPASADPCHSPVCLSDGSCGFAVNAGAACDDGDACTTGDACQADGSCAGTPIVCPPASNSCHTAGACQTETGRCSAEIALDEGARCDGGICHDGDCCVPEDRSVTCANDACGPKTNNCGQTVQCLHLANDACAQDSDCCSGVCVNGTCKAGPVATGGRCDSNGDCASHACCGGTYVDITSDIHHCNGCGNACADWGMATVTCVAGVCGGNCLSGYADCNHDLSDGCEVSLASAPDNCLACGHRCPSTHVATRACDTGVCGGICVAGYDNCDGTKSTNGCNVDLHADPNNCGACGNACTESQYCASGVCADKADIGLACAADGHCQSGHCCGGVCVDVTSDFYNCSRCGNFCRRGMLCNDGNCMCPAGETNCYMFLDCFDLLTNPNHCGDCGHACPAGNICVNGYCVCDAQSCCPGDETYCLAHLGTPAGCTDTQTDVHHCGGCSTLPNGQIDPNAKDCSLINQTCCGAACVDTLNDHNNCGACGHQCPTGGLYTGACSLGVCTMVGCPPGFGNCDANAGNGCESNLSNDVNNCGACGNVCPGQSGGAICHNGACCIGHNASCGAGGLGCCGGNNCGPFNAFTC